MADGQGGEEENGKSHQKEAESLEAQENTLNDEEQERAGEESKETRANNPARLDSGIVPDGRTSAFYSVASNPSATNEPAAEKPAANERVIQVIDGEIFIRIGETTVKNLSDQQPTDYESSGRPTENRHRGITEEVYRARRNSAVDLDGNNSLVNFSAVNPPTGQSTDQGSPRTHFENAISDGKLFGSDYQLQRSGAVALPPSIRCAPPAEPRERFREPLSKEPERQVTHHSTSSIAFPIDGGCRTWSVAKKRVSRGTYELVFASNSGYKFIVCGRCNCKQFVFIWDSALCRRCGNRRLESFDVDNLSRRYTFYQYSCGCIAGPYENFFAIEGQRCCPFCHKPLEDST